MENEPCRWTSVQRDNLVGGSLWGLNGRPLTSVPLKSGTPLSLALSLFCSEMARFFWNSELRQQKLAAFNTWPSLKIEPTLRQISAETLESLKLRERNFKHRTTPEQPVKPTEGHPQEWRHVTRTRGIPSTSGKRKSDQRHFNLKASNQITFILLNRGASISKVKLREFSIWWSTRVKSWGNRTVLDCNHSQLNSLPVRVCMYVCILF